MCDDVAGIQVTDQDISKCIKLGAFEDGKTRPVLLGVTSGTTKNAITRMGKTWNCLEIDTTKSV